MIPLKKDVEVQISEDFETNNFSMAESPEAFSATVDTLYEDKVGSPAREYMTNAADAHVEAGHTDDFEVKLPTALDPVFSVKDTGPGLTHEQVLSHLTRLFSTSKKGTNKQTGYLGLGSKSIFAYTDSGTLVTRRDGIQRSYILARADSGIPQVTLASEIPTDFPNGTEIRYSVKEADISRFKAAAEWLLFGFQGFPVQPKFNIVIEPTFAEGSEIFKTENVFFYRQKTPKGSVFVRQGPVLYPINSVTPTWADTYNHTIVINVPIGTVAVATSRESLSLDDKTQAIIQKIVDDAGIEVEKAIEVAMDSATNLIDASRKFRGKFSFYSKTPRYKGKTLLSYTEVKLPDGLTITDPHDYSRVSTKASLRIASLDTMQFYYLDEGEDLLRAKERWHNAPFQYNIAKHLLKGATKARLKKFKEMLALDDSQFIALRTLPDPGEPPARSKAPRANLTPNATKDLKPYTVERRGVYGSIDWTQTDVPADGEYYWLPVSRKGGTIEWKYDTRAHGAGWFVDELGPLARTLGGSDFKNPMATKPILLMTASVQTNLNPPKDKRLDVAMQKTIKKNLKMLKTIALQAEFNYGYHVNNQSRVRLTMLQETGLIDANPAPRLTVYEVSDNSWVNQLLAVVGLRDKVKDDNVTLIKSIAADYPLIFKTPSKQDLLKAYISLMKETKTKGKVNVKI